MSSHGPRVHARFPIRTTGRRRRGPGARARQHGGRTPRAADAWQPVRWVPFQPARLPVEHRLRRHLLPRHLRRRVVDDGAVVGELVGAVGEGGRGRRLVRHPRRATCRRVALRLSRVPARAWPSPAHGVCSTSCRRRSRATASHAKLPPKACCALRATWPSVATCERCCLDLSCCTRRATWLYPTTR